MARIWLWLTWNAGDFLGSAATLPLLFIGPAGCIGYWLLRGWRQRKFARWATVLCAFCGAFLAVVCWGGGIGLLAPAAGAAAVLSAALGQSGLLRYTDPDWYQNPRRIACVRAGGAFYNHWSQDAGQNPLPGTFQVGEHGTLLQISGGTVRVERPVRKGRTFSVQEVAGVIVGPSTGSCVLYDANFRALAKFGTSLKNARLMVRYLKSWDIPFYRYDEPIPEASQPALRPEEMKISESRETVPAWPVSSRMSPALPRSFSVPLRHPAPAAAAGIIAAGFLLGFTAFAAVPVLIFRFADPGQVEFLMTYVWGTVPLSLMLGPVVVLALTGHLLPADLVVEDQRLYRRGMLRSAELTDRITGLRQIPSDGCWVLYDRKRKPLAKFSGNTPEGSLLLKYLYTYHIAWVRERARERT